MELLSQIAEMGPVTPSTLLGPFGELLRRQSNIAKDLTIRSFLYARLRNLLQRELVEKNGREYSITPPGLDYLPSQDSGTSDVHKIIKMEADHVKEELATALSSMDPFAFEQLIGQLLVAMNYNNVEVTTRGGDGGVDVIADMEMGITSVHEVVQVKRHQKNIQRKDLDALRGSLHRFKAVRGTLVTTSSFSRGTTEAALEPGAAPITLIDGKKLVDLLIEYGIGVRKKELTLLELDLSALDTDPLDEDASD